VATYNVAGQMVLPIGKKSARDLDRYLRLRAAHPRAEFPWLLLGPKGPLTPSGIHQMIKDRGTAIGLPELHPPSYATRSHTTG
jgi:hypothetical protein